MIFDEIKQKLGNLKNIIILNNFPYELQNNIINDLIEHIKDRSKKDYKINRIYEDTNIKKINEFIANIDLFTYSTILVIYKYTQNIQNLKKILPDDNIIIILFTDEKNIREDKDFSIIEFPKDIDVSNFINKFCQNNGIKFENKEVEALFKSYFNGISSFLEKTLQDILVYLKKIKKNIISKEIAIQFLSFSSNYSFFSIINSFFQKDKFTFFYQYMQLVESENDFNVFFQPFLKEIKLLAIISSVIDDNNFSYNSNKSIIISFLNKLNIQYNPYKLQYDLKKIENFGKEKIYLLLEFLLSIDIYSRYYDKSSSQKLFEIGINQFI
ncbi:MAG: hypothetical protein ACK4YF_01700 [Exilispira sp.]